ncbi:uncharacterized protein LOC143459544 [Clavelina lepadiformis]|uniref:uncharacterized protein LOC143459544 n=1 Tax=Clavelina lepadiformis TaxID=159417 RepID=UPI00404341D3
MSESEITVQIVMGSEERLAREIKKHECLYNSSLQCYRNRKMKDEAWKEVSTVVGLSPNVCLKRWKLLRDKYLRQLKRSGNGEESKWDYMMLMDFLRPYVRSRELPFQYSHVNQSDYEFPRNGDDMDETLNTAAETSISTPLNMSTPVLLPTSYTRPMKKNADVAAMESKVDEDSLFFASITASVRAMPASKKWKVKTAIMKVVSDAMQDDT